MGLPLKERGTRVDHYKKGRQKMKMAELLSLTVSIHIMDSLQGEYLMISF